MYRFPYFSIRLVCIAFIVYGPTAADSFTLWHHRYTLADGRCISSSSSCTRKGEILYLSSTTSDASSTAAATTTVASPRVRPSEGMSPIHEEPPDAIIHLAPKAMLRLIELREKQWNQNQPSSLSLPSQEEQPYLILRMGVRNGGCSGMSYVMDFATEDSIRVDDDQVDVYEKEKIKCVVDSRSMLYLYDMELDYSDALIGGGFKFYNPNSQETCGCGSSFSI